jgi:hypothetical protein
MERIDKRSIRTNGQMGSAFRAEKIAFGTKSSRRSTRFILIPYRFPRMACLDWKLFMVAVAFIRR